MALPLDQSPFPTKTRGAVGSIQSISTEVTTTSFADRILITVRQSGRLAHWLQVPLLDTRPGDQIKASTGCDDEDDALLPLPHLTPRSLLGATDPERDSYGQLLAVQIASIISNRNPEESRILLLGLGLDKLALDDDGLLDMLQLIGQSLP